MSRRTIPPLPTTKELSEAGVTRIVMPRGELAAPPGCVPNLQTRILRELDVVLERRHKHLMDGNDRPLQFACGEVAAFKAVLRWMDEAHNDKTEPRP